MVVRTRRKQVLHRHVEPLAVAAHLDAGSASSTFSACSWKVAAFASISSPDSIGRVAERPLGIADARGVVADDQHDV